MTRIGFLGLGAMGSRMAARLIAAGYEVKVWNRTPDRARDLMTQGATLAATPRAAAEGSDVVISMVRDDTASTDIWEAPETGALFGMTPGAVGIECSTLTIERVRTLAQAGSERGIDFVDAPLAGSRPQAEAGQLIFFAGGSTAARDRVHPVLQTMGAAVHNAGPKAGDGMIIKLMVNALFGVQVAAVAELLAMTGKLGLDPKTVIEIVGSTPVMSPAAKGAAGAIAARAFAPAFPIDLVEKDFGYVQAAAANAKAALPAIDAVRMIYRTAKDHGLAADNITGVAQLYD